MAHRGFAVVSLAAALVAGCSPEASTTEHGRAARPGPGAEATPVTDGVDEPLELDLLRTVHLGIPVGVGLDAVVAAAAPDQASHTRWVLARAALAVLGRPVADTPVSSLLDDLLVQLREHSPDLLPGAAPPGYGDDDLVYTVLYAAAVSGQAGAARNVLARHLDDEGSSYKHGVVLQALHLLGGSGSMALIQGATERRDVGFLAGVLTRRHRDPPLVDLARHWRDVPPAARSRETLFGHVEDGCTTPAILAAWLVGYLPPAADPERRRRDAHLLRTLLAVEETAGPGTPFPSRGCYNGRYFALRSLALHATADPATWARYASALESATLRKLAASAGFAHDATGFAPLAFRRLGAEPAQYAQWELLWGTLFAWNGTGYRDYWDLWHDAPDLQFRLSYKERLVTLSADAQRTALDWLEAGERPADDRVRDWLLAEIANAARGREAFRLLHYLQTMPAAERAQRLWVLYNLEEPAALPLLRYWAGLEAPPPQRERLEYVIDRLETAGQSLHTALYPPLCCEATEQCLRSQLATQLYSDPSATPPDADAARAWLARAVARGRVEVTFLDDLGRTARVVDPGTGRAHRFEHL